MKKEDDKIRIELSGPKGNEDALILDDFIDLLRTVKDGLRHVEQISTKGKTATIQYRIVDLSHASPFKVTLEPFTKTPDENFYATSHGVISSFIEDINTIEGEKDASSIDDSVIEAIQHIGKKRMENFSRIVIGNGKSSVNISDSLGNKTAKLYASEREVFGTVYGTMETLNVHNEANIFRIYPNIGASRIECKFKREMFEKAKEGLGRYIKVAGMLKYRGKSVFPSKVDVVDTFIMPKDDEVPSLLSLRGIAPGITGKMSTADFIRSLRDDDE